MRNEILFTLFLTVANSVVAQEIEALLQPSVKQEQENLAKNLIEQYKKQRIVVGIDKNEMLEKARSLGLKKTQENYNTLDALLTSNVSDDEKVTLIKTIGDFYLPDDAIKANAKIRERLRAAAMSNVKSVAKAAVLTYSRMGYFDDSFSLLKNSFNLGNLDKTAYGSELSHLVWFADWENQKDMLGEISENSTEYARKIFSHYYANKTFREKINPALKAEALDFLLKNEPKFSTAIGEYSMVEAFSYSDWLHSVAMMTNDSQPESYEHVVMRNIGQVVSNPKKTIAFLISDEGQVFLAGAPMDDVNLLLAKVDRFSDSLPYPQSSTVKSLVKQIHADLGR